MMCWLFNKPPVKIGLSKKKYIRAGRNNKAEVKNLFFCDIIVHAFGGSGVNKISRAPLGGGGISSPPSRFIAISSKPMQVSPPNLQYPLSHPFYTLC